MEEEIVALLEKLGIAKDAGPHSVGKFDMDISKEGKSFAFWLIGKKRDNQAWIFNRGRSLIVVVVGEKTMVSDLFGLKIIKHIGDYLKYPHMELHWIGWDKSEDMRKGTLTYAQLDFSSSQHAFYQKEYIEEDFPEFYSIYNNLSSPGFFKKMEEAGDMLEEVIVKRIDFDVEVDKLIRDSGLEGFLKELRILAENKKPILLRD